MVCRWLPTENEEVILCIVVRLFCGAETEAPNADNTKGEKGATEVHKHGDKKLKTYRKGNTDGN